MNKLKITFYRRKEKSAKREKGKGKEKKNDGKKQKKEEAMFRFFEPKGLDYSFAHLK